MTKVARHDGDAPSTLAQIATCAGEPPKFVQSVMGRLDSAGLVVHSREPIAGYCLARSARRISVAEILEALEDTGGAGYLAPLTDEDISSLSGTDLLWQAVRACLVLFLRDISLADLLEDEAEPIAQTEHLLPVAPRSRILH